MAEQAAVERRFFRAPLAEIGYLRFVVESYEGLAQMRSLPRRTEIEWIIPLELVAEADGLARSLAGETGLAPIDPPPDWDR
jgi:hypothetical protein